MFQGVLIGILIGRKRIKNMKIPTVGELVKNNRKVYFSWYRDEDLYWTRKEAKES